MNVVPWSRSLLWLAGPTGVVAAMIVTLSSWPVALTLTLTVTLLGSLTVVALTDTQSGLRRIAQAAGRWLLLGWGLFGLLYLIVTDLTLGLLCLACGLTAAAVTARRAVLTIRREIGAWVELAVLTDQPRERRRDLVADVSDRQLGHLWRASGQLMRRQGDVATHLAYLQVREQLLDELETRHPEAFARGLGGVEGADRDGHPDGRAA